MRFFIAGVQFHDIKKVINELQLDSELKLVPEPTNKFDSNAVRVEFNGTMIGYIPKKFSASVSADIELGIDLNCRIVELNKAGKPWEMCKISLNEKVSPKNPNTEERTEDQ